MKSKRLTYLVYRCNACKRILTSHEIERTWEKAEKSGGKIYGVCPCGSAKISPTNPSLFEELFIPRIWEVWFRSVLLPKFGR